MHSSSVRLIRSALLAGAPLTTAAALLVYSLPLLSSGVALLALLACLLVLIIADWLAGDPENGSWAGYINLALAAAWLALGLPLALLLLVLESVAVALVRWRRKQSSPITVLYGALARLAINGNAMLVGAGLYIALGAPLPLQQLALEQVPPLAAALLSTLLMTQMLGYWLCGGLPTDTPLSSLRRIVLELLLLLLTPVLATTLHQLGIFGFSVLMVLVAVQAIRTRQVRIIQDQLTRRVRELTMLNTLNRSLTQTLRLDDLLLSIYHEVRRIAPVSAYYVALYDDEYSALEYRLALYNGSAQQWQPQNEQQAQYLMTQILRGRHPHALVNSDGQFNDIAPEGISFKAYLGVPLLVDNQPLGIIGLLNSISENVYTPEVLHLVELVANQAGIALRNARQFDLITQLVEGLSTINQAAQDVVFNLDSEAALNSAANTGMRVVRGQAAAIYVLDPDHPDRLTLMSAIGLKPEYISEYASIPLDQARRSEKPHIVPDVSEITSKTLLRRAQLGGFRALAEVPLRSGSIITGMMMIFHHKPRHYRAVELELLEMLSYQITAAYDNTQLLRTLENYAAEQAQLLYLSRISAASLDLNVVLAGISNILHHMVEANDLWLGLSKADKPQQIRVYYSRMLPNGENTLTLLADDDQTQPFYGLDEIETLRTQPSPRPRLILPETSSYSQRMRQFFSQQQAQSVALLPMVSGSHFVGALLIPHEKTAPFGDTEWQLLEVAVNQIATQLYNVQLYTTTREALKRRLEQLALIEQIALQISSELDFEQVITHLLNAALRATEADIAELALIEGQRFRIIGQHNIDLDRGLRYHRVQQRSEGVIAQVADTRQTVLLADNLAAPQYVPPEVTREPMVSSIVVPLVREDRVIGVLNVESRKPGAFNEEQADFLKNLAGHAMISIQNARLLEDRHYQVDALTHLSELALRVFDEVSVASTASAIVATALRILPGADAALFEYHADKRRMYLLAGQQTHDGDNRRTRLRPLDAQPALDSGKTETLKTLAHAGGLNGLTPEYPLVLAVPIKRGSTPFAVLCVGFGSARDLLPREQAVVDLLAAQATAHLENALLQERILANNRRMRAILDANRDSVVLLDKEGRLLDANTSAERLMGVALADRGGEYFAGLLLQHVRSGLSTTETEELENLARLLRSEPERITRREYTLQSHDRTLHIEEIGTPVFDNRNNLIGRLLVLRDMTEQKQLSDYREEITNLVVHDLRSPLGALISGLSMVEQNISSEEDRIALQPLLNISTTGAYNLLNQVDSLLDIARWEVAGIPLQRSSAALQDVIANAVQTLVLGLQVASVTLRVETPDTPLVVRIDAELIRRVLVNLIDNAMRYTPPGGDILVLARQHPENPQKVLVSIADSGPGIPEAEHASVFLRFKQISSSVVQRGTKGSGLGLYFCKLVVEAHGEQIRVESDCPLSGACITLTLPLADTVTN